MYDDTEILVSAKLDACPISDADETWAEQMAMCEFVPVSYCHGTLRFNRVFLTEW